MAMTTTPALVLKGALNEFRESMDKIPQVWENHVQIVTSTTQTERYSFAGMLPKPRVFDDVRHIQGFRDFTFNVENNEYELSILVKRKDMEDDQTSEIMNRFREFGEAFGSWKNELFATLLEAGAATAPPFDDAGGTTFSNFYDDTSSIGSSGTIDNDATSAIVASGTPTSSEILTTLQTNIATMQNYADDQGRKGFNGLASSTIRCTIPPAYQFAFMEALNATIISNTTNVFTNLVQFDVLPFLGNTTTFYMDLMGANRKPFIMQQRTPLEIIIDSNPTNVAARNGWLVMCRERFELTYGEPRRSLRHVFTTA